MSSSSSTVNSVLVESRKRLTEAGIDSPGLSARLLVSRALGLDEIGLITAGNKVISPEEAALVRGLVTRRVQGEPVAYIVGQREFYSLNFKVTPATLIPRPETELIIDLARERFTPDQAFIFADWGTGSGILASVLLSVFSKAKGAALDLSAEALSVAAANIADHGFSDRCLTVRADFTRTSVQDGSLDLLVCNPPYVTCFEYEQASEEVTRFEPKSALVSGEEGMDHIRALAPLAKKALKPGGVLLMEIGCGQGALVREALTAESPAFDKVLVHADLAGLDRVVEAV